MAKKLTALAAIISILSAHACELTITNDTGNFVQVHDLNTNEKIWILPSKSRMVGKNPDIHAKFVMNTQSTIFGKPMQYSGSQKACSKEHKINLKVSDIEKGTVDTTLFEIKKG